MTILIPALNASRFVKRVLMSVFNQTRDDWDVQLLIDSATTDNTYQKAQQIRTKSKRWRNIHINVSQEPGLPNVYKELIDRAEPRDDVCGFLDVDDHIVPAAVEKLLGYYESHFECGHVWSQFCLHPSGGKGWSRRLPPSTTQREAFVKGWWGAQHWRTFRKSTYSKSRWQLQLDIPYATDYNLALVLAATNCKCGFIDKPLYVYHRTPGGITQSKQKKQRQCFQEMLRRFQKWVREGTPCESSLDKSTA